MRVRIFVGDNRDIALGERQQHALADDRRIALVARVNRNRAVAQHRLGARRGDGDIVALLAEA